MSGPMDEVVKLAQAYKVAKPGPESEAALVKLCTCVEKLVMAAQQPTSLFGAIFGP